MSLCGLGQRFVLGSFAGLGAYGVASYGLLLLGQPVSEWIAVAAAVAGSVVAVRTRPSPPSGDAAPAWLAWTGAALLLIVAVALVFGSLATPSRHWDGAAAWEMKAFWLTQEPTIEQAFFRDPGVFSHSRDYPLLQPLLVAAGNRLLGEGSGRLLFPFLYLLIVASVGVAVRRGGADGIVTWFGTIAIGVLPMLVSPTSGAVDSGYADTFLTACLTATAAGLLLKDRALLFLGVFLTVLVKPEGVIYGGIAIPILWCRGERSLLRTATAGWLTGAALWLPLQHDLYHLGDSRANLGVWGALLVLGVGILAVDSAVRRTALGTRTRMWIVLFASPLLLLALPLLVVGASDGGSSIGVYLHGIGEIPHRLSSVGEVAAGFIHYGLVRWGFGLTFWLLLLSVIVLLFRRIEPPAPRLWIFVMLGMVSVFGPFLLSPEVDMQHHIRSSMARLQLHWVGAAWILVGTWIAHLRTLAGPREAVG